MSFGPDDSGKSSSAQAFLRRTMQCLRFGILSTLSFRHIGLSTEVKNVPWFSHSPDYVPSRRAFLVRSTAIALICCVILDISAAQSAPSDPAALFNWDLVPLFARSGQLTSSQLNLRLLSSLVYWINMFCVMQGLTTAVSVFAVGFGLSDVEAWRPLFDSPLQAYSLRKFWR